MSVVIQNTKERDFIALVDHLPHPEVGGSKELEHCEKSCFQGFDAHRIRLNVTILSFEVSAYV